VRCGHASAFDRRIYLMTEQSSEVFSVEFPVKLNDDYTCQGREMPDGPFVAFDDLLNEGDLVAKYGDGEGNTWGPNGIVVRREDGLWVEEVGSGTVG
jgi:hypothetical protein